MRGRLRCEGRGWAGTIAVAFAIGVGLLLLNAISVAPATHHHEAPHNPHDCPICTIIATGSWAPAPSSPPVALHRVAFLAPAPEARPRASTAHPLPPVRGPPAHA
ncbi:MAG: hypothetical protein ACOX9R_14775 [Armatimonadota bacterium]|jgi:hypothetical protein